MSRKPAKSHESLQVYETLKQASQRVQLSERTLRRYMEQGKLAGYRVGRNIRFRPQDVDALFTPTNQWSGGGA